MNPRALGERAAVGREADRKAEADLMSTFEADVLSVQPVPRGRDLSAGVQDSRGNSCLTIKEQRKLGAEGEQEASVATLTLCCNSSLSESVSPQFRVP